MLLLGSVCLAESIVDIYDLLQVYAPDKVSGQPIKVYTSDEIYSFPWNTNVCSILIICAVH